MQFTFNDILKLLPELMLALLALLIIIGDLFPGDATPEQRFNDTASTATLGLAMIFVVVLLQSGYIIDRIVDPTLDPSLVTNTVGRVLLGLLRNLQSAQGTTLLNSAIIVDDLLMVARLLFIGAGLIVALLAQDSKRVASASEFFGVLVLAVVGFNLLAGAGELVTMYLALELSAITLYILVGFTRPRTDRTRGLQYPLFGIVSSGVLLYGLSLLYGFAALSGNPDTTSIPTIAQTIAQGGTSPFLIVAAVLVVVGMSYKIAAVPFHAWTGDVYERTPAPVTALIGSAAMAAATVLLFRILALGMQPLAGSATLAAGWGGWSSILAVVATLTMVAGNVVALRARNVGRILAGTTVAHSGFVLIALVGAYGTNVQGQLALTDFGVRGLIYALVASGVATLGAWSVLSAATRGGAAPDLDELRGLHGRHRGLAALFAFFAFALAGIPPLNGFWARFFVLAAGWETGAAWLSVVGLVTILLSAVAYLRLVRAAFGGAPSADPPLRIGGGTRIALVLAALFVVAMSIAPTLFLPIIEAAPQSALTP